jgi:hypothetical protein
LKGGTLYDSSPFLVVYNNHPFDIDTHTFLLVPAAEQIIVKTFGLPRIEFRKGCCTYSMQQLFMFFD